MNVGILVSSFTGDPGRPKSGPIGLQLHDQFTSAQFRNIKIRKLATVAVDIASPLDYQVVQRTSKSGGAIPLKGSATMPCDTVEYRIDGKPWERLGVSTADYSFDADIPTPAGGWYKLEVRALKNGKPLAASTVEHVGMGEVFVISGQSNSTNFGETKTQIDKKTAIHYYGKKRPGRKVPSLTDGQMKNTPPVPHPVVRTHEETGAKALYVHETMTDYVEGMEPAESEALLRRLYDHSTQNLALQYHHQWRTGDFVIWDDRALLHAATADYAEDEKRLLYRTMLKGGPTH